MSRLLRRHFQAVFMTDPPRYTTPSTPRWKLGRIELNEHIPPSETTDLAQAASDVLDALAPLAEERGVRFSAQLPPLGEAAALGDRDQIVQVIQNLVHNALKYSPDGGGVSVLVEAGLGPEAFASTEAAPRFALASPDVLIG